ncbi:hypothetical protein [Klebsiella aerogenes]|uniref:Uncharacterized protein n=1 Tax=Klebsiella aerogenes TaxID=548 RepID=A0AAP9QZV7_KLEAE|nr:hypothetical protein [Klebsiella aerogenes]QMR41515.1 hypothetical protein HV331_19320 [Klebsiella aerogenes]
MRSTNIYVTPVIAQVTEDGLDIGPYLHRHLNGEWGDISEAEKVSHPESPESNNGQAISVWRVTDHITLWITLRVMLPLA